MPGQKAGARFWDTGTFYKDEALALGEFAMGRECGMAIGTLRTQDAHSEEPALYCPPPLRVGPYDVALHLFGIQPMSPAHSARTALTFPLSLSIESACPPSYIETNGTQALASGKCAMGRGCVEGGMQGASSASLFICHLTLLLMCLVRARNSQDAHSESTAFVDRLSNGANAGYGARGVVGALTESRSARRSDARVGALARVLRPHHRGTRTPLGHHAESELAGDARAEAALRFVHDAGLALCTRRQPCTVRTTPTLCASSPGHASWTRAGRKRTACARVRRVVSAVLTDPRVARIQPASGRLRLGHTEHH
ncbi:hypothetical protein FB451DRAFT_1390943 [Mycena latifolia]|nr:hypothetical protein FB451DRAFT_1390943 [Mycena latifolia]